MPNNITLCTEEASFFSLTRFLNIKYHYIVDVLKYFSQTISFKKIWHTENIVKALVYQYNS